MRQRRRGPQTGAWREYSVGLGAQAYQERSPEAMFNLGFMHEFGAGVPKDLLLAARFYDMAVHTSSEAALAVYCARAWLLLHRAWEALRPWLPARHAHVWAGVFALTQPHTSVLGSWTALAGSLLPSQVRRACSIRAVFSEGTTSQRGLHRSFAWQRGGRRGAPLCEVSCVCVAADWRACVACWQAVLRLEVDAWRWLDATGVASLVAAVSDRKDLGETAVMLLLTALLLVVLRLRRQRFAQYQQAVRGGAPPVGAAAAAAAQAPVGQEEGAGAGGRAPPAAWAALGGAGAGAAAAAAAGNGSQQDGSGAHGAAAATGGHGAEQEEAPGGQG